MSFPHYPEYKDSGVEWLGEVPRHWEVKRLSMLASMIQTGPFGSQLHSSDYVDEGTPVINPSNIQDGKIEPDWSCAITTENVERLSQHKLVEGDIVFGRRGEMGRCALVSAHEVGWICGTGSLNVRLSETAYPQFVSSYLRTEYVREWLKLESVGSTMDNLNTQILGSISVPVPPLIEQTQIAAFLDCETAKIDALVAEQRRLMALLKDELNSLVLSAFSLATTQQIRLAHAADLITRPVTQREGELYTPLGLYNRGRGLFHKDPREMVDMGDSDFFWIEDGDLIISGQFAWEGSVALAGTDESGCVVSHRYPVLRGKSGVALTEYLFALLCTDHGDFLLNESSWGAAGRNRPLNIGLLLREKIPVPTMETQVKVARAVRNRKKLVEEIAKQTSLLHERRTALISAAVTGQIDVRSLSEVH